MKEGSGTSRLVSLSQRQALVDPASTVKGCVNERRVAEEPAACIII